MRAILDIYTGQWEFIHDTAEIQIGFKDSRSKTVRFNSLKYGYKIGEIQKERDFKSLIQSDQPYLSSDSLSLDGEVTLEVWAENADQRYKGEVTYEFKSTHEFNLEKWRKSASLSRRRFKIGEAIYTHNGTPLVELIEALLAGLPEPDKTIAGIAYRESAQFDRLDPFIVQFSGALGMTDEEVDEFFQYCLNEGWNA